MTAAFLISQVLVVLQYAFFLLSYYVTEKKEVLFCNSLSLLAEGFSYFFLGGWSGVAMVAIGGLRNFIFAMIRFSVKDKNRERKYYWIVAVVYYPLSILFAFLTFNDVMGLFAFASGMIYTLSLLSKSPISYKVLGVFAGISLIIYYVYLNNVVGLVLESILVVWIFITFFIRKPQKEGPKLILHRKRFENTRPFSSRFRFIEKKELGETVNDVEEI